MSKYVIDSATLTSLADAARGMDGSLALLSTSEIVAKMQNFFVRTVNGDGTGTLAVEIPFSPDALLVYTQSPYAAAETYQNIMTVYDLRTFLRYCGMNRVIATSNTWNTQALLNQSEKRPVYASGVLSVAPGTVVGGHTCVYNASVPYTVVAVKYTEKSDRELLTEVIAGLPDSAYTATFSQYRVNATVTESEWAALTQTKPNVTFALT